jgi:hypothetical protein
MAATWIISPARPALAAAAADPAASDTTDPVLGLLVEKGMITEAEAAKAQAQVDARRTNLAAQFPASVWKISPAIKSVELYGDLRLRYEDRSEKDPAGGRIDLQRERYALRVGLRGEAFDDFYYGFRLETSSNPRSTWATMGTSSSGTPYQGPFGKSTAAIGVGQIYLGWRPESWFDFTAGKMPNPLYTTPMVWSPSINPEGLAERFKYTVGDLDFFATFGQFDYADQNPNSATGGLGFNGLTGQGANNIFQVAWQGGFNYHLTTNTTFKAAATIYQYLGLHRSSQQGGAPLTPYFGDPYVGEGAYTGPGSANQVNGYSGYGGSGTLPGYASAGYPNNQVGLNDLSVLEVPFELNFKISQLDARVFGDVAYNLEGAQRAQAAAQGYAAYLANQSPPATIHGFSPQTGDCKAYQIGFALGSPGALGLVNGATAKKHAWEVRTYWQHVEQYALDPNLPDTDFFAGAQNLQGIYAAVAYGLSDNFIATIRYGEAKRINHLLGTGGTGQDIPQINPISTFNLFQADLTFKF